MSLNGFIAGFNPEKLREVRRLELKKMLDQRRCFCPVKQDKCQHDMCKKLRKVETASDFAQFANADGGLLLFGVAEDTVNRRPEVVGLKKPQSQRNHIEQAVKSYCEPLPIFRSEVFKHEGKSLLIFEIDVSIEPVWTKCPRDTVKLVRRVEESKMSLDPLQIQHFVTDMARANAIRLKQLCRERAECEVQLGNGVVEYYDDIISSGGGFGVPDPPSELHLHMGRVLVACDEHEFELRFCGGDKRVADTCTRLPYSTIEHVWQQADNRIGIILNVQLLVRNNQLCVSPHTKSR